MNKNLRAALAVAITESLAEGNDAYFTGQFVGKLNADITMPHDTFTFDLIAPDGITVVEVTARVTVTAPVEPA